MKELSYNDHARYMKQALTQARKAYESDEVPIGAVVVRGDGTVIARAYNQVEKKNTQTAHAEMIALVKATKSIGDWRLDGVWVYVTLEPCGMCMAFMQLSRVAGVVYAAGSPLFGYRLDNAKVLPLYKRRALQIIDAVGARESQDLLRRFFKEKRK